MNDDSDPAHKPSGPLQPGFDESQRKQYELMLAQAHSNAKESEQLLKRALAYAQEFEDEEARLLALHGLHDLFVQQGKHNKSLIVLEEVYKTRLRVFGKKDAGLVRIRKEIGKCHFSLRQVDKAIEVLRETVLLCQKSSEDLSYELVDSLTVLAGIYRSKNAVEQARICIRQAFEIVADESELRDLQIRVLEELATVTFAQHKKKAASQAFIKVLSMKLELYGAIHPEYAQTLVSLSSCYIDLGLANEAESCLLQAIDIMHRTKPEDKGPLLDALQKLAGLYHSQGRFIESTFLEQRVSEIIGRAAQQRLGFFKQFDAGLSAQEHKHYDVAYDCYNDALLKLEFSWGKNALVRIPILCRQLEIANIRKQKAARKLVLVEIEELLLTGQTRGNTNWHRLNHVARLFRILGHDRLSEGCYTIATKMARDAKDINGFLEIADEKCSLLDRMDKSGEAAKLRKFLRRLRRLCRQNTILIGNSPDTETASEAIEVSYLEISCQAISNSELLLAIDME